MYYGYKLLYRSHDNKLYCWRQLNPSEYIEHKELKKEQYRLDNGFMVYASLENAINKSKFYAIKPIEIWQVNYKEIVSNSEFQGIKHLIVNNMRLVKYVMEIN